MPNILNSFLASNLLPIGQDDEKLKLLEAAADAVATEIREYPLLAYRLMLVGFDEGVSATDPVHGLLSAKIAEHWQTMTNKTGPGPVQVHRAVMLRAIEIEGDRNQPLRFAATIIARTSSVPSALGAAGDAIRTMIGRWEAGTRDEMSEAWVNPVDMSLPKLSSRSKKPQVSKQALTSALRRAAGPQAQDGSALNDPNPHWPNEGPPWSYEFAGRAAAAIDDAIRTAASTHIKDMHGTVREVVQTLVSSLERLTIRDAKAELLWIRASLYSPTACKNYGSLSPNEIVLHAAVDTSRIVAAAAPPSVEYFLRNLVTDLAPARGRLLEILGAIGPTLEAWDEGQSILTDDRMPRNGRRSWLDYALRGGEDRHHRDQIGVSGDYEDDLANISVELFRELQIRKLLAAGPS